LLIHEIFSNPKYKYIKQEKNEGGAGGFHVGIKAAFELGARWIWTMDDDIEWKIGALSYLMEFSNLGQVIQPSKEYIDQERYVWEGWFDDSSGRTFWKKDKFFPKKNYVEVNYACFEGMLIHRDIVDKIGYPDKQFFLTYDDLIYGWLASFHTKIIYSGNPVLVKNIHEKTKKNPSSRSPYFIVRNLFLVFKYLKNTSPRFNYFKASVYLIIKTIVVLFRSKSFFQVKLVVLGFKDGLTGKFYELQL
jgi:GT2 family glycosyltransferase